MTTKKHFIIMTCLLTPFSCGVKDDQEADHRSAEQVATAPVLPKPDPSPSPSKPKVKNKEENKRAKQASARKTKRSIPQNASADEESLPEIPEEPAIPMPPWIQLDALTYAGTGCPGGSADVQYLHDGKTLEISTNELFAKADATSSRRDRRRSCQVLLALAHTPGWQFAIERVDFTIHPEITAATIGEVVASTYIQGEQNTDAHTEILEGPLYESKDLNLINTQSTAWSPCDSSRALNAKIDVRLKGKDLLSPEGLIAVGNPITVSLKWRECASTQS